VGEHGYERFLVSVLFIAADGLQRGRFRTRIYRRVFCDYIGSLCERGEYFSSEEALKKIVQNVQQDIIVQVVDLNQVMKIKVKIHVQQVTLPVEQDFLVNPLVR
jgi:hypothetical protein